MGRQLEAEPLWRGGAGSRSNTMWPGPKPICVPSFILINQSNGLATIHQRHRQDRQDRTDRTDRQTDRQRSDSIGRTVFGRPFVKRFALCYRTVVCLSVLSVRPVLFVTFVCCGQTVGRIKMKLGRQVGLDPDHIVLDGDPAPPPSKGHSPLIFGPISVAAKWLHGSRSHLV